MCWLKFATAICRNKGDKNAWMIYSHPSKKTMAFVHALAVNQPYHLQKAWQ